jgi:hypothetical protein
MIVKILAPNASFSGVNYNTNKIDRDKGELMRVANFGPLQGLGHLRPQDYINYLKLVSAQNKRITRPQFHAVISAKEKTYDKSTLTKIATDWLKEMGYGLQPYLVVYHKDTQNNHVHIVTTRVGKDGKKISSAFENVRAIKNIEKVLGYEFAFQYRFSTRAQFFMLLENQGFLGIDPNEQKIREKISAYALDKQRSAEIRSAFLRLKGDAQFRENLHAIYQIDLVFHAVEGKEPYGYSIIDHERKMVFKGSEVMPLKALLGESHTVFVRETTSALAETPVHAHIQSIWIADDVDDQQIHGMRRRRQKKARTNTR